MSIQNDNIRYLNVSPMDELWGIVVTTVDYQSIPPYNTYPVRQQHPLTHSFDPEGGHILTEYQLVYISEGCGFFGFQSSRRKKVKTGTMVLLFPGEWHTYSPVENGWYEYWVSFRGNLIEDWVSNKFSSKEDPVHEIGVNVTIIGLYEETVSHAIKERNGYQRLTSSIVLYLMGKIYYREKNRSLGQSDTVKKINEARALMKRNIDNSMPMRSITQDLNMSYFWFRNTFESYTGVSSAQYQLHLRYLRAKELLNTSRLSISEIAHALNSETVSQLSTFFTKKEGLSPSKFRRQSQQ